MARAVRSRDLVGLLVRLRTDVQLISDIDLERLAARYAGAEHDEVQTLIAFARELRTIERALR